MSNKKFILNADDFGISNDFNKAVLDGYNKGFLKSASLVANGDAFDAATNEILPECPELGVGIHLNIIEGKALSEASKVSMLCDSKGNFNNGYLKLIAKSNDKLFLQQAELEFRAQIEKIMSHTKVSHIDSHVHTHAIPPIFELVCKLAKEYGIKQVRTQRERFYIIPNLKKHLNIKYPPNILKVILLNYFTAKNLKKIKEFGLETNEYLIGVGYTGMMDEKAILHGILVVKNESTVEALIHPCNFQDNKMLKNQHEIEFSITQNLDLKDSIERLGFEITNYKV